MDPGFVLLIILIGIIVNIMEKTKKGNKSSNSFYVLGYGGQGNIEDLDTMDIPYSGFLAAERRQEYRRRGQSPSGFIDGVYNDMNRPSGVPCYDGNRDWCADD